MTTQPVDAWGRPILPNDSYLITGQSTDGRVLYFARHISGQRVHLELTKAIEAQWTHLQVTPERF